MLSTGGHAWPQVRGLKYRIEHISNIHVDSMYTSQDQHAFGHFPDSGVVSNHSLGSIAQQRISGTGLLQVITYLQLPGISSRNLPSASLARDDR
jgi:hypothetical protein